MLATPECFNAVNRKPSICFRRCAAWPWWSLVHSFQAHGGQFFFASSPHEPEWQTPVVEVFDASHFYSQDSPSTFHDFLRSEPFKCCTTLYSKCSRLALELAQIISILDNLKDHINARWETVDTVIANKKRVESRCCFRHLNLNPLILMTTTD